MNKKLLAVAIGAALSAPMLAQADVKVSGQLHVSLDYLDSRDYVGTAYDKKLGVSSNSSNFKIEVSEDVGGGMKAIGLIQEYVRMDHTAGSNTGGTYNTNIYANYNFFSSKNNTTRLYDGEAYVGLSGGFGTVLLGAVDSPAKKNGRAFDFFGNQIGDSRNVDVNNSRVQNAVSYTTPAFAGVTISAVHATNLDNLASGSNPWGWGAPASDYSFAKATALGVTWKSGAVTVGAAMDIVTSIGYAGGLEDEKWMNLGASFDVGPATIRAFVQQHEAVSGGTTDKQTYGIGASVKVGANGKVKVQYYNVTDQPLVGAELGANLIAVGYDHSFSKTFTGYIAVAQSDNDLGKSYSMSGGGHGDNTPTVAGEAKNGVSAGMILNF